MVEWSFGCERIDEINLKILFNEIINIIYGIKFSMRTYRSSASEDGLPGCGDVRIKLDKNKFCEFLRK